MTVDSEARAGLEKHEAICAERYRNIMELLQKQEKNIDDLNRLANMGRGSLKTLLMIGGIIGGIISIINIIHEKLI